MLAITEDTIFINNELAAELKTNGVIKIPFLNAEELGALQAFYNQAHGTDSPPTMYDGIHMTIWHSDTDYKLNIREKIKSIIEPACQRTFKNYRAISQQFIVKKKGNETTFPIHQDWSIVDETKYFSLNLWIPLHDVDETNGAMWIVKRSHHIQRKIRGGGYLFPNYYSVLEQLKPYMTSYPMKAGEALLFYHSTIHGSPANQRPEPRVVVQVSVLPESVPLQIYFQKDAQSPLEVHQPKDDFNFYYQRIREDSEKIPPSPQPVEVKPAFQQTPVSLSEVLDAIQQ